MLFDSWYSGLENLKRVRDFGWRFLTQRKVNLAVDLNRRHKIPLLGEEFGDAGVDLMRRLKTAWDPLNILNPGKVVRTT